MRIGLRLGSRFGVPRARLLTKTELSTAPVAASRRCRWPVLLPTYTFCELYSMRMPVGPEIAGGGDQNEVNTHTA